MQIYEIIANLFMFALSFFFSAIGAFLFFIVGDALLEEVNINKGTRYIIIFCFIVIVIALIN
jgi:hypothetical protein|tara:strand:+ start:1002 stop:1187 length:186 start_codon:yes stop_codon:yes gene_type:complete